MIFFRYNIIYFIIVYLELLFNVFYNMNNFGVLVIFELDLVENV